VTPLDLLRLPESVSRFVRFFVDFSMYQIRRGTVKVKRYNGETAVIVGVRF